MLVESLPLCAYCDAVANASLILPLSLPPFYIPVQPLGVRVSILTEGRREQHHNTRKDKASHVVRLSSGKAYRAQCEVWGTRPNKPKVTWWMGNKQVCTV